MNGLIECVVIILLLAVFYSFQGSKHVYRRYIRPFFLKHQTKIERFLNILSKELVSVFLPCVSVDLFCDGYINNESNFVQNQTKFVSSHEDEIRFIENMAIRGATTGIELGDPAEHDFPCTFCYIGYLHMFHILSFGTYSLLCLKIS
jgi:hypothetical protein